MTSRAKVVIGANYGDEGKGLMTDFFAAQAPGSIVARFNGGCQAGHTVTTPEGHRHVFSHFGSGLLAGADTYLSRHFAVNPALFFKERNLLATALGKHTLYVDQRAPVTTFFDMLLNQAVEAHRGQARHGSCGMGFGETIGRHESAYALSVGDLLDKDGLYEKLVRIRDEYVPARRKALGLPDDGPHNTLFSSDTLVEAFLQVAADFMAEVVVVPNARAALQAHPVVLEGAQGLLLDQTNGAFPHVTRSNTGLANALDIAIESGIQALDVTYVTRAYLTRHGAGPLANELPTKPYADIVDLTNQPNTYQGSLRFAYLDHDQLAAAIQHDLQSAKTTPVECWATLAVSCLDQVGEQACFWEAGKLQHGTVGQQLASLASRVLPLGHLSWGPTRATIEVQDALALAA